MASDDESDSAVWRSPPTSEDPHLKQMRRRWMAA
jgi:hypothetical protein